MGQLVHESLPDAAKEDSSATSAFPPLLSSPLLSSLLLLCPLYRPNPCFFSPSPSISCTPPAPSVSLHSLSQASFPPLSPFLPPLLPPALSSATPVIRAEALEVARPQTEKNFLALVLVQSKLKRKSTPLCGRRHWHYQTVIRHSYQA